MADFPQHLPDLVARVSEPPTLLNGDLRADNLFFDADGDPVVVDFQLMMRGAGIWDVAYLVGQGMTPAERDRREKHLVQRYARCASNLMDDSVVPVGAMVDVIVGVLSQQGQFE